MRFVGGDAAYLACRATVLLYPPQVSHSGGRNRYLMGMVLIKIKYAVALGVVACPPRDRLRILR